MIKFTCESQIDRNNEGRYRDAQHQKNAINLLTIDQEQFASTIRRNHGAVDK